MPIASFVNTYPALGGPLQHDPWAYCILSSHTNIPVGATFQIAMNYAFVDIKDHSFHCYIFGWHYYFLLLLETHTSIIWLNRAIAINVVDSMNAITGLSRDGEDTSDAFLVKFLVWTEGATAKEQMDPCLKYDVDKAKQIYRISSINSLSISMATQLLSTQVLWTCQGGECSKRAAFYGCMCSRHEVELGFIPHQWNKL